MKKLIAVVALVAATAGMISCGNSTPKASLKTDIDTLSYSIGLAQTNGLKDYLRNMGIDTTMMDEFIKGLKAGANAGDDKKKQAYFTGYQIGQQISNQMMKGINYECFGDDSTQSISLKNFMAGFIAGAKGEKTAFTQDEAMTLAQEKMKDLKAKSMEKKYGANRVAGEKFLAENAKKEGVVTLPSGVQYKVLKEGKGPVPADTSLVKIHYVGRTLDKDGEFDNSYSRKDPVPMRCNQAVKGFTEALTHMPEGSVWEVYIPQHLGYAEREMGKIKPFSVLIFKIELVQANAK